MMSGWGLLLAGALTVTGSVPLQDSPPRRSPQWGLQNKKRGGQEQGRCGGATGSGRAGPAHLLVNFSLLRHRLQTKKPESSPSTRTRLRAPPKMGQSSGKEAGGDAAPGGGTLGSQTSPPSVPAPPPR